MIDIGVPEGGIRKVLHIISTVAVDRQRKALRQTLGMIYRNGYPKRFSVFRPEGSSCGSSYNLLIE